MMTAPTTPPGDFLCSDSPGIEGPLSVSLLPGNTASKLQPDLIFSSTPSRPLRLDLLRMEEAAPWVIVLHGGGWREGNRKDEGLEWLVEEGFTLARIEYRFSMEAAFPAQLDDCKAAINWLRERAGEFGLLGDKPAVLGTSAGGHLALLLAAENLVSAAVAYCAPTDFIVRARSQPQLTESPGGVVHDLLGGPVMAEPEKARSASPAWAVHAGMAPCLLINGTADLQVRPDQPASFLKKAIMAGADVSFLSVPGAAHCGEEYHAEWIRARVAAFLRQHLESKDEKQRA